MDLLKKINKRTMFIVYVNSQNQIIFVLILISD